MNTIVASALTVNSLFLSGQCASYLYHSDCSSFMKTIPDNSIDCILTDPPYSVTNISWDNLPTTEWLTQASRILKPNGYLVSFGTIELFAQILTAGFVRRFSGTWLKPHSIPRLPNVKLPRSQQERFEVFTLPEYKVRDLTYNQLLETGHTPYTTVKRNTGFTRGYTDSLDKINYSGWTQDGYKLENNGTRYITDTISCPGKQAMKKWERTTHPTQKPIRLLQILLMTLTNSGDAVLDPFAGSNSTGLAAWSLSRNYIGVELFQEYFEMSVDRTIGSIGYLKLPEDVVNMR